MKKYIITSFFILLISVTFGSPVVSWAASTDFTNLVSGENIMFDSGFPTVSVNNYVSEENPAKTLILDNELYISVNGLVKDTLNGEVVFNPSSHTITLFSNESSELNEVVIDYQTADSSIKILGSENGTTDIYFPANKLFSEEVLKKVYNKNDKLLKLSRSLKENAFSDSSSFVFSELFKDFSDSDFAVEEDFSITKLSMKAQEAQNRKIILTVNGADPVRLLKETYSKGQYIEKATTEPSENGARIVFELSRICAVDTKQVNKTYEMSFVAPRDKYDRIVVVDPGHGDYDCGAVRDGVGEAKINLEIAKNLTAALEKEGIKVYMTRKNDVFLELETRPKFSTEIEADMFISIHQNTHSSAKEKGLAVYYSKDNNNATENGFCSKVLGQRVIKNLYYDLEVPSNGLLSTPLSVTTHNTVPAILIECGFMTNPDEFAKLQDSAYQKQYGENIAKSVIELFTEYPTGRGSSK